MKSVPSPVNLTITPVDSSSNLPYYFEPYPIFQNSKPECMSYETLENVLRQLLQYSCDTGNSLPTKIIWQGGEPALAGLDFFKAAGELIEKYSQGRTVEQHFYTNGTLVTKEWFALFQKQQIIPVIFVHGPKELYKQDPYQRLPLVEEALERMLRERINFRTSSAILRSSCTQGEKIYDFLSQYAFYMDFYPMTPTLIKACGEWDILHNEALFPNHYSEFFNQLFDAWSGNGRRFIHIQQFDAIMRQLDNKPVNLCCFEPLCQGNTMVDLYGNVYPCIRADAEEYLGNLNCNSFAELQDSCSSFANKKTLNLPEVCIQCQYSQWCFCGCPKERVIDETTNVCLSYLCDGYKKFLQKVLFPCAQE